MPHYAFSTAWGTCAIVWNAASIEGFHLPGDTAEVENSAAETASRPAWLDALAMRVGQHLTGQMQDFATDVPYAFERVSEFQRRVYHYALTVKAGQTRTYGDVAAALDLPPGGARAVGAALGANPWPLLVPCHRFVGAGGRMTGFSAPGGIRTKTRLLALEGAELLSE
ncbi:methylated-DNA--[protein]-cysteine S-methyltransferase [Horticoccus luteus]|uniref:Methylated-DNA--[protein]-cysteine S-methyltransferase n=1 Tax=Horticoccus luteus TaxID=2862869 RepID=A0A8F9TYL6_9BACT|nr:methylated-DNA--[protein]-cysteine S-methyltransferase [Horticoccus luteus]QYM80540.1 methylated-DNA--[protein]-cysteine S-methyltransferase [Horticoccus luteus]